MENTPQHSGISQFMLMNEWAWRQEEQKRLLRLALEKLAKAAG